MASTLPSCPWPRTAGLQGLRTSGTRTTSECRRVPLVGFGSSPEVAQAPSRCLGRRLPNDRTPLKGCPSAAPPMRFLPLQRFPARGSGIMIRTAKPDRQRLQVFTTSWRLDPPRACRPCFMPDPLLGEPFRAFFLPRSRALLSSAPTLLTFGTPSGFCSTRESATGTSGLD